MKILKELKQIHTNALPYLLSEILEKVYSDELDMAEKEARDLINRYLEEGQRKKIKKVSVGLRVEIELKEKL